MSYTHEIRKKILILDQKIRFCGGRLVDLRTLYHVFTLFLGHTVPFSLLQRMQYQKYYTRKLQWWLA